MGLSFGTTQFRPAWQEGKESGSGALELPILYYVHSTHHTGGGTRKTQLPVLCQCASNEVHTRSGQTSPAHTSWKPSGVVHPPSMGLSAAGRHVWVIEFLLQLTSTVSVESQKLTSTSTSATDTPELPSTYRTVTYGQRVTISRYLVLRTSTQYAFVLHQHSRSGSPTSTATVCGRT